jgi:hypothetical protein
LYIFSDINISQNDIKEIKENDDLVANMLPPCDRTANSVEEVYKVDDLLSSAELSSLESNAVFMMENPPTSSDEKCVGFSFELYFHLNSFSRATNSYILVY